MQFGVFGSTFESRVRSASSNINNSMNVDDAVKFAKERIQEVARMARDPRQQEEISEELSAIEQEIARVGSNVGWRRLSS